MKILLTILFFFTTSLTQISDYTKKIYLHHLNHDITYSYSFIVDKSKVNSDKILSTLIVKTTDDTLVAREFQQLTFPNNPDQTLFSMSASVPINLENKEYVLEHKVSYGQSETMVNVEDINFPNTNSSDLYLFSGKSKKLEGTDVDMNGIYYQPNFDNRYVIGKNNAMYWYIEFYDVPITLDTVKMNYTIYNEKSEVVRSFKRLMLNPGSTFYANGFYNVMAKLKTGNYRINLSFDTGSSTIEKNAYFSVFKNKKKRQNFDFVKYDIDHYFVLYKLESDKKTFYQKLGKEKQIEFIASFMINFAKAQNVQVDQVRKYIDKLSDFIQVSYGNQSFNPYKLDVTMLLFKYGQPSNIDRVISDPELKEHEIWEYNSLKNGVKFYLSNYDSMGIKIIHCSDPSFGYTNREWKRLIRKI